MKFYLVGGAVRDMHMGLESNDFDFVVVGASPEDFKSWECVGNDFPVFLEPTHGWEVALARIERKVGTGYTGFESEWKNVSLNDDLYRRDLTINAMAYEVDWDASILLGDPVCVGSVIDPFGGLYDLKNKTIAPVSQSFNEDSVRLLRAGRFLARYDGFNPSFNLITMCNSMQDSGELKSLTPERVWQETEKVLKESNPRKYFEFISKFEFEFSKIFLDMQGTVENNDYHQEANVFEHTMMVLDHAVQNWGDPEINFACLMHDIAKPKCYKEKGNGHGHDHHGIEMVEEFCKKWRVPNCYRDLARITCGSHQKVHVILGRKDSEKPTKANKILQLFEKTGALQHPERFLKMLKACESDSKGRIGKAAHKDYIQRPFLKECLAAAMQVKTKDISKKLLQEGKSGPAIGHKIREARIGAIRKVQNKWRTK